MTMAFNGSATETYVPRLGDRVEVWPNIGPDFTGTIRALQYAHQDHEQLRFVWVEGGGRDFTAPFSTVDRSPIRVRDIGTPADTLGRWIAVHPATQDRIRKVQNATQSDDAIPTGPFTPEGHVAALRRDLKTIGEHLKATAERHEWCGEYETHLSRLCDALSEGGAEALRSTAQRARSFTVSYTITVEGSNRAEAIANAQREAQSGSGHWGASERES